MEEKIKELADKYDIPEQLVKEAIKEEKTRIVLKNRRFSKKLQELIERYT